MEVNKIILLFSLLNLASSQIPQVPISLGKLDFNEYLTPFKETCHCTVLLSDIDNYDLTPFRSPVVVTLGEKSHYERLFRKVHLISELIENKIGYLWQLQTKRTCLAHFLNYNPKYRNEKYWDDVVHFLIRYWSERSSYYITKNYSISNFGYLHQFGIFKFEKYFDLFSDEHSASIYKIDFTGTAYVNVLGSSIDSSYRNSFMAFPKTDKYMYSQKIFGKHFAKIYFHDIDRNANIFGVKCLAQQLRKNSADIEKWSDSYYEIPSEMREMSMEKLDNILRHVSYKDCGNMVVDFPTNKDFGPIRAPNSEFDIAEWMPTSLRDAEPDIYKIYLHCVMIFGVFPNTSLYGRGLFTVGFYSDFDLRFNLKRSQPLESSDNFFVTHFVGFNFIAFQKFQEGISWRAYSKPFQSDLWMVLTIFMFIGFPICAHLILYHHRLSSSRVKKPSVIFILFSYLIEQSPEVHSKIQQLKEFIFLFSLPLLVCVIFTNAYRGLVTTDVIAPFKVRRLETFDDLYYKNYTIRAKPSIFNFADVMNFCDWKDYKDCVDYVSSTNQLGFISRMTTYVFIYSRWNQTKKLEKLKSLNIYDSLIRRPRQALPIILSENGTDLSPDGEILVDLDSELDWELMEAHKNPEIKERLKVLGMSMYKGKANFLSTSIGFSATNTQYLGGIGTFRIRALIESGIFDWWEYFSVPNDTKMARKERKYQEDKENEPIPITMGTNIQTVFILYLGLIPISILTWIIEILRKKLRSYLDICVSYLKNGWIYFKSFVNWLTYNFMRLSISNIVSAVKSTTKRLFSCRSITK